MEIAETACEDTSKWCSILVWNIYDALMLNHVWKITNYILLDKDEFSYAKDTNKLGMVLLKNSTCLEVPILLSTLKAWHLDKN